MEAPLRIAITGMTKTGKSTLMNSLVQQYIVPTAVEVLTYNVNWFHHVKYSLNNEECIIVHFHNGDIEKYPLMELDAFVKYTDNNREYLDSIHWVDVFIDNPLLLEFDLIDTPGLGSLVGTESQHTRDLLTTDNNRPDAIIYLMKKGIKYSDISIVKEFHEATGLMSGINTVAAFSRVDELNGGFMDAQEIINGNIQTHSEVKFYFSRIFPIAALMAECSFRLTSKDIRNLITLASKDDIEDYFHNRAKFVEGTPYLNSNTREILCNNLSISGIRLVISNIKSKRLLSETSIRQFLYDYSRVEFLKQYLIQHFGQRAEFMRAQKAILRLKQKCQECARSKTITGSDRKSLLAVSRNLNSFMSSFEEEFAPFYILTDYYNKKDYFEETIWNRAKRVLGEYGDEDSTKFESDNNSNREDMIRREKDFWLNTSYTYSIMSNLRGADVARKIAELIK